MLNTLTPLSQWDPEINESIEKEKARQYRGLEMIASENLTSKAVMECLGSALTNKYAEGEVGARYYGGTQFVDEVETVAKTRALAAFSADAATWGVNVQPYSGSPANFAVYTALLPVHGRIMGLDLPCGGHLTHGFYTAKKKISATSIFFESMPYHTTAEGTIDYDEMERVAEVFRPAMIIIGASAYPKDFDFVRVRKICDSVGCLMMMDMAHTAGLIAGKVLKNPFEFCDIVTTTTHKSLRGPRAGMIFFRKVGRDGKPTDFETRINQAVFPGLQGGPHMHQIAAIATQMKEVMTPEWATYAKQVQTNCSVLAQSLIALGHKLVGNGSENHLCLWDVKCLGLTGAKVEKLLDMISVSSNKNTIPGDKSALSPGGIRLGASALTTRDMKEEDMKKIAAFLDRGVKIATAVNASITTEKKTLKDFADACAGNAEIATLKNEIEAFATSFPMPGFDVATMKYKDGIPSKQ